MRLVRFFVELFPAATLFLAIRAIMFATLDADKRWLTSATKELALAGITEICAQHCAWPEIDRRTTVWLTAKPQDQRATCC